MVFLSKIIVGVKRVKNKFKKPRADSNTRQIPTPVRKPVIVDHRPEIEKLEEAIDLRIGGAHVPFEVLKVRNEDGCRIVQVCAHTPADDDGSDSTEAESGPKSEIELSLVMNKWWKDVAGEIMHVADGNRDGCKIISVLFCLVDPDDEMEQDEEEYVKACHEFESEDFDLS
ncbi:hypothetical protein CI238_03357 [Colletotrichum incanum]|uniref:Uncharacterized protein n=1 Tax=Colletotrichum incanum TaxID=1573173 RepID=A0A167B8M3_COLIC|nr:hypothetical protein CI238_03357 [Colletotrichum incanum]OHW94409.1 hypothetical protein CSPAE12_06777 [Colletotrichum incanum]